MNSILFLIVIPLMAAFLSMFLGKKNRYIAYTAAIFNLLFSIGILLSGNIPFNVAIGSWSAPYGINFVATDLSIIFLILVNLGAVLALTTSGKDKGYPFYAFFYVLLAGTNGLVLTGDIFNFFLFVELSTFATAGLVAYNRNKLASGAALKYLIVASVSSAFALGSIGLIYKTLGTLNLAEIALRLGELNGATLSLIIILFLVSLLLELKIFPFNIWVVKAYEASNTEVNLFLHGMFGTAGIYAALRFLIMIFGIGQGDTTGNFNITATLAILSFVTVIISEVGALTERNMKKILAYSTMGQMGMILFAISLGTKEAYTGIFFLVISNFLAKFILFMVSRQFSKVSDSYDYTSMRGLGRNYALLGIAFTAAALSLMGIPFFAGFLGKLTIISSALLFGKLVIIGAVIIVLASVVEGVYFLRIAHTFFTEGPVRERKITRRNCVLPALLALMIIVVGVYPDIANHTISTLVTELTNVTEHYISIVLPLK